MKSRVIAPGDHVAVTRIKNGYYKGGLKAIVLAWTPSGRLKVKCKLTGVVQVVSPENVKKLADGTDENSQHLLEAGCRIGKSTK